MAFPSIVGRTTAVSATSNSTTWDTSAATLSGSIGDLLVAVVSSDGNPTLTANTPPLGADWTKLGQASNGTIVTGAVFWKIAETADWGSNGDILTVSSTASEQYSGVFLRLSGANLQIEGTSANGSSTNSNPPNEAITGGVAKDVLWIATRSGDSTVVATAAPTNYANLQTRAAGGTGGASTNTAERSLNASAEDPGTFTSASEQWVSWTLAVYEQGAVSHDATGSLAGPGASVSGSATRNSAHDASGNLIGPGGVLEGNAARTGSGVSHDATAALQGPGASVAGTSARTRQYAATGTLQGAGAALSGSSARFRAFAATGVLQGAGASLSGAASRTRAHESTGALSGAGPAIAGTAARIRQYSASGVLSGAGATIAGSAARTLHHSATGALTASSATLAATAARSGVYNATGALAGPGATLAGAAARTGDAVTHSATGTLIAQGAILAAMASKTGWSPVAPASGVWSPDTPANGTWTPVATAGGSWS